MIGGLNNNGLTPALPDPGGARDRREPSRGGASYVSAYDSQAGNNALPSPPVADSESGRPAPDRVDQAAMRRRVEARQAAAESRLETFQTDQVSLASSRALDAFTTVAGYQDRVDVELAGVDIRV